MKICLAQTKSIKGNVSDNIKSHLRFIDLALTLKAEAIFFPELSLTGYEPTLANKLVTNQNDPRFDPFQQISDNQNLIIGFGLPTTKDSKIRISMVVFGPNCSRQTYSKQILHADELPYFEAGTEQIIIQTGRCKIAPAICFESLQPSHAENAAQLGANVYLASVAKSESGVQKAMDYFPKLAKQHAMPVLMANSVGFSDNFLSAGKSAVWNKNGKLVGQFDDNAEGLLIFDTETDEIVKQPVVQI